MADIAFTNNSCGNDTGAISPVDPNAALNPGDRVVINGSADLSNCIVGPPNSVIGLKRGYVSGIELQEPNLEPPIYRYRVLVWGAGPEGVDQGSLQLHFTDQSGDRYALSIWMSGLFHHEVSYNSDRPGIIKIEWGPG